jgi:hypothetical protein
MPTSASGIWRCGLCLSEHEKLPRGGGGEGEEFPVLIENLSPGLFPGLRQIPIQRPHIEKIFTKIKN